MITYRVLLVDDDSFFLEKILHPIINTLINQSICTKDFLIESKLAYNGKEGWDTYQEYKPDIVVTDYNMPIMGGEELAAKIASATHQPKALFLISSDPDARIKNMTKYINKKDVMNLFVQANKTARN